MTATSSPTHQQLAAAISQFQIEQVNNTTCGAEQRQWLETLASTPPEKFVILKNGSRSLVGKHTLPDGTKCVLKYYRPKNLAKKINYRLRGSRARQSWLAARAFQHLGIPTPPALLLHEQKGLFGFTLEQSLLACHLAPGIPLSDITEESTFKKIAPQLNQAFSTMASFHIAHGDLKANNIIVDPQNNIRFIDLDGTTLLSTPKTWSKLWLRDRNRFLRNWPQGSTAQQLFAETIPTP